MKYIEIPYDNATLRIRRDKIYATLTSPTNSRVDIYTPENVFHVSNSNNLLEKIWENDHDSFPV